MQINQSIGAKCQTLAIYLAQMQFVRIYPAQVDFFILVVVVGGGVGVGCSVNQKGLVLQKDDWSLLLLLSSSTPPKAGAPSAVCASCCRSQQLPGQKSKSEMHPCPPKIHSSRSAVLESLDSTTRQSARVSFVPQLKRKLEKKKEVASRSPRLGFGSQDSTFKMLRCFL